MARQGKIIQRFRADRGGEYIDAEVKDFFAQEGIIQEPTPSYSHESNGVAERFNRTIITMARAMLAGLTLALWSEAISTVVYLKNRLPHKAITKGTPYEALHNEKPSISHLQPFGRKCFVHIPEERRPPGTKLLPRAVEGKFIGYTRSTRIFRIYIPKEHRITETRQVKFSRFNAGEVPTPPKETTTSIPPPPSPRVTRSQMKKPVNQEEEIRPDTPDSEPPRDDEEEEQPRPDPTIEIAVPQPPQDREEYEIFPEEPPPQEEPLGRGHRQKRQTQFYQPSAYAHAYEFVRSAVCEDEPATYRQALNSHSSDKWRKAMDEELAALERQNTFDLVPRPSGRTIVGSKWVYKIKRLADGSIERYKARGVAKGFSQQPGYDYDEIFAPVVRYESLRLLLALCAHFGWKPRQFDVKSAFLYGKLSETVYMQPLPGYEKDNMVWKLNRCIYGLKQSAHEWYGEFSRSLLAKGFQISTFDPCVFVHHTEQIFISVYVDDITIFAAHSSNVESLIDHIKTEFEVTDLGIASWLLGLHITYTDEGISLSQQQYIDKVLDKFLPGPVRSVSTPLDKGTKLRSGTLEDRIADPSFYQSIVGSLMYAVTGTRPDLAYAITTLSQFCSCPTQQHLTAAKHALRYLSKTKDWTLFYPAKQPLILEGYADADYAGCIDTRRSISSYLFRLGKCTISWKSRKQGHVAVSTTEAEYVALSLACRQTQWLKKAFVDFRLSVPCALFADSTGCISITENDQVNDRTKHIDVHFHKTREELKKRTFELFHIPSQDNLADVGTKILDKPIHERLTSIIRGAK